LTRAEHQAYWLTKAEGNPDKRPEAEPEIETKPEGDEEPVDLETVEEALEEEELAVSAERTLSMVELAQSPPPADQEVVRPIRSEEKGPEVALSQNQAPSSSQRLEQEQEAEGESTPDLPNFDQPDREQFYVPNRMVIEDYQCPVLTPAQEAGQVIIWLGTLRDSLTWQDQERRDIEELLGCFPTLVRELKKERDEKVIRVHELEEKWSNLDSKYRNMIQE
jgi:hypothetical protein